MHDIAANIKSGNVLAFKMLFDRYYAGLCVFAARYLKSDEECEDVVQDVFVGYWERRNDFDEICKVKSYLYTAVRNACLNILRHEEVKQHYVGEIEFSSETEECFEDVVIEQETYLLIQNAIKQLPPQMRRVVLYTLDGLKNAQIAEKMGIGEGTVKALKQTAYKKLRVLLRDHLWAIVIIKYFFSN